LARWEKLPWKVKVKGSIGNPAGPATTPGGRPDELEAIPLTGLLGAVVGAGVVVVVEVDGVVVEPVLVELVLVLLEPDEGAATLGAPFAAEGLSVSP
jgi:hypothetical protein